MPGKCVCVIGIKCNDSFFRLIMHESYLLSVNENAIQDAVNFLERIMTDFIF